MSQDKPGTVPDVEEAPTAEIYVQLKMPHFISVREKAILNPIAMLQNLDLLLTQAPVSRSLIAVILSSSTQ